MISNTVLLATPATSGVNRASHAAVLQTRECATLSEYLLDPGVPSVDPLQIRQQESSAGDELAELFEMRCDELCAHRDLEMLVRFQNRRPEMLPSAIGMIADAQFSTASAGISGMPSPPGHTPGGPGEFAGRPMAADPKHGCVDWYSYGGSTVTPVLGAEATDHASGSLQRLLWAMGT